MNTKYITTKPLLMINQIAVPFTVVSTYLYRTYITNKLSEKNSVRELNTRVQVRYFTQSEAQND